MQLVQISKPMDITNAYFGKHEIPTIAIFPTANDLNQMATLRYHLHLHWKTEEIRHSLKLNKWMNELCYLSLMQIQMTLIAEISNCDDGNFIGVIN